MPADCFRLRVRYGKRDRLRYLGHLEVLSTIDRCVRRAHLPFAVSEGFTPRLRINFTSALPVACASAEEYYDLLLTSPVPVQEAYERLLAATPPDLAPDAAAYVAWEDPALEAFLTRSDWSLLLRPVAGKRLGFDADGLAEAVARLADAGTLTYLRGRKEKRIDLSATLVGFGATDGAEGVTLALSTRNGEGASLRPDVLARRALETLEVPVADVVVLPERLAQFGEGPDGELLRALPPELRMDGRG